MENLKIWLKKHWIALTLGVLIFGSVLRILENKGIIEPTNPQPPKEETDIVQEIDLLDYSLIDEEISDTALKTQVIQYVEVSGELTKENLESLLVKLYKENLDRTGFKHYTHPNSIFIFAYKDKENYEGDKTFWVAKLSKSKNDTTYTIEVEESLLNTIEEKPEVKFGFTEEERKTIYKELVNAEGQASKDAEVKFPLLDPLQPDYSSELAGSETIKRLEYANELMTTYKAEIRTKYGIEEATQDEIISEGLTKKWPLPEYYMN